MLCQRQKCHPLQLQSGISGRTSQLAPPGIPQEWSLCPAEMWEGFSRKHTTTLESGNGTALQRGAKSSPGPGKECKERLLSFFPTRKESLLLLPERIHYWEHNKPGVGTSWLTPAEAMWHTVWHQQGFVSSHLIPEESHRDMGGTSHSWDSHPKVKYPLVNNWGKKIAVILSCPNF